MTTSFWHTDAVGGRPHHHRVIYRLRTVGVPNDESSPNSSLWLWVPAFAGTTLPFRAPDHRHQLRDLLALVGLVAARDRMLDAMGDVIFQNLFLDPAQRGTHRRDLRHDVDAIAVLLDHFREAANLPLDPAKAFSDRCLDVLAHEVYIPP